MGITSRKLTAIVAAMPMPTYAAVIAPRSMTRVTGSRSGGHPGGLASGRGATAPPPERVATQVLRRATQLALDPEEPVVLRDALAAGRRPGLDLAGAHRDDEVGDRRVLGLAGAMRHDRRPAGAPGEVDRLERLGERPDLVQLDQHGVRRALVDRPTDAFRVRHEQVVADELHPVAEPSRQLSPAGPVVLGQAVLDRDDREAGDPVGPEIDQLAGVERPALLAEDVARRAGRAAPLLDELARRRV